MQKLDRINTSEIKKQWNKDNRWVIVFHLLSEILDD